MYLFIFYSYNVGVILSRGSVGPLHGSKRMKRSSVCLFTCKTVAFFPLLFLFLFSEQSEAPEKTPNGKVTAA